MQVVPIGKKLMFMFLMFSPMFIYSQKMDNEQWENYQKLQDEFYQPVIPKEHSPAPCKDCEWVYPTIKINGKIIKLNFLVPKHRPYEVPEINWKLMDKCVEQYIHLQINPYYFDIEICFMV